jgi:hypothetical protein
MIIGTPLIFDIGVFLAVLGAILAIMLAWRRIDMESCWPV